MCQGRPAIDEDHDHEELVDEGQEEEDREPDHDLVFLDHFFEL